MLKARQCVREMREYHSPLSSPNTELRLDMNESTTGCSPRVLAKLNSMDARTLAQYPRREAGEKLVADFLGVAPQQLLLTNGADEAIDLLCRAYLEPQDEIVIVVPTFAMYEVFAQMENAKVIRVPTGPDFSFPLERVLDALTSKTRIIVICNPNNPTGIDVPRSAIMQIIQAAPDAAILLDEAYFDFYGQTMIDQIGKLPNLFIARTFSKAYGLAGLRLGVMVGDQEQMSVLRRMASPFNVNAFAIECLAEALADRQFVADYVAQVIASREWLRKELEQLGFKCWPSHGNFILCRFGQEKKAILDALRARGISLRDRPDCEGCVRITIGKQQEMERLIAELKQVLSQLHREPGGAMRKASIERITTETQIKLALTIEGGGRYDVSTGIRFLDHMLELFARHGAFDLKLKATGDLDVDQHHTVEDVGIALGEAFHKALGDKRGIMRAGYFLMPMDETLGLAAIDFSGRAAAVVNTQVKTRLVGDLQSELVYDFFEGFARGARANVHLKTVYGRSNHHKIEALFKAFARALRVACSRDKQLAKMLPSTKGLL